MAVPDPSVPSLMGRSRGRVSTPVLKGQQWPQGPGRAHGQGEVSVWQNMATTTGAGSTAAWRRPSTPKQPFQLWRPQECSLVATQPSGLWAPALCRLAVLISSCPEVLPAFAVHGDTGTSQNLPACGAAAGRGQGAAGSQGQ